MIKRPKQNTLSPGHVGRILEVYLDRKPAEHLSDLVSMETIQANDFNLNLPRYVDTSEPEPPIDGVALAKELAEIRTEEERIRKEFRSALQKLRGTTEPASRELNGFREELEPWLI